jgi:squalene-hopene/tetraprenyl-beta-curcumene cyclase
MSWGMAARDHDTFCISCHTALPYALARPVLRQVLGQLSPSIDEQKIIDDVTKRVRLWQDVQPYYPFQATNSRGTEAVLNALILASRDARQGRLGVDSRTALEEMWTTQEATGPDKGAWPWIMFGNEPWEAKDSVFYGASLAAIAVGIAPGNYRSTPEIQDQLNRLVDYLRREYPKQTLANRVVILWASAKLPGLLSPGDQQAILSEIASQQHADGGWCLADLVGKWKRRDGTPQVRRSDGYATGLITFTLEEMGIPRGNRELENGLSWLEQNQSHWFGNWSAYSLNRWQFIPFFNRAQFMDDAATAYAVLALTKADGVSGLSSENRDRERHSLPQN